MNIPYPASVTLQASMNNPIPSNMKSEAKKAAKILREFTEISNRTGPDKLIPANILAKCQGLAIITVIKAGFMITARGGSGIVIARLADGHLVVILMQRRAVDSFSKGGNLTLGGNCTVAVGPMGRNVEADVALRSTAAVFTYLKPSLYPSISAFKSDSTGGVGPWDAGPEVVTAIHPFTGQQPGDLSFNPGDRITVVTKTESQYDWWEGTLNGRTGIFPANFVSCP
ncbi:unnamed protein product [Coregonus sp. 'balchen']|nr:unnamed protein product [Coregonus sp. 'balchen']